MHDELNLAALVALDQERRAALVAVQLFTATEWPLLVALFGQYPAYCPYEVMLAHFHYHQAVNERTIERMRAHLHEAQEEDTWDVLLRPMRNVLSRVRLKLRPFGIAIVSLVETGYALERSTQTWHDALHRKRN